MIRLSKKNIIFQVHLLLETRLEPKETQVYTDEFKLNVLNDMKTTGTSYLMTAIHFGISETGTIAK